MKRIRLTQIDGKLPNIALMKLSFYFKENNFEVILNNSLYKELFEEYYSNVFVSSIFKDSNYNVEIVKKNFNNVIIGGTGTNNNGNIEDLININEYENYDYSIYDIDYSIGFSQRGCRLRCPFCFVPKKEGGNKDNSSIIKLIKDNPKNKKNKLVLLDNDFFGQKNWRDKAEEIIDNNIRIVFSQGLNIRLINEEQCKLLSQMQFRDNKFKRKRIYTAWDNSKDEKIFFRGINLLLNSGIKANEILVYFLCNYYEKGLTDDVLYRFNKMKNIGLLPFPMIFDRKTASLDLLKFQEFVIQGIYRTSDFKDFINKNIYKKNKLIESNNLKIDYLDFKSEIQEI